jgi:septum formation protein
MPDVLFIPNMKDFINIKSDSPALENRGIILASQSPRRKQLLEWAEIPFEIVVQETDESYPAHLPPDEIAVHIARNKALAVNQTLVGFESSTSIATILAADTIVVLQNQIIGKPKNREDAVNILSRLSGNNHKVITGVVILHGDKEISFADVTDVEFHTLTKMQIEFYVDKYKPYDKAGAYAIQEWIGVVGIKCINGDFYNVMGLPVSRVVRELNVLMGNNRPI